jgi:hypothetical protein
MDEAFDDGEESRRESDEHAAKVERSAATSKSLMCGARCRDVLTPARRIVVTIS